MESDKKFASLTTEIQKGINPTRQTDAVKDNMLQALQKKHWAPFMLDLCTADALHNTKTWRISLDFFLRCNRIVRSIY